MGESILSTNILPSPLREQFNTQKISARTHAGGVLLLPIDDIRAYRGIAKGSGFTTDTLLSYRREEQAMEDRGQSE